MSASEEEPAGYRLPGQGLISPVQAWPAWTEHRRCSAVDAQIHLFGRDRKGQTEAGTAVHIGRFAFVLGSLCVTAVLYGQLRPAAATAGRSCASGCAVTEQRPRRRRRRCRWRAGPGCRGPVLADSGIGTVRIPCPGAGLQPSQPLPFLDALEENPSIASTVWRADPASEEIVPETCLVRRLLSEGRKRYSDTAMTW